MSLRIKAPLLVLLVALVTSALTAWSSYNSNITLLNGCKQNSLSMAAKVIEASLQDQTSKAVARATMISDMPSVQRLLRAKDQKGMSEEVLKLFEHQRDQFGVREAHFHLPPAFSFLRVLGKTVYMEDLSGFREMVLATNRRQETQRGIEISKRGLSVRGICVIKDEEGPIGSFEVGMDFGRVLEDVKKVCGCEAGVFVDDKLMTEIATAQPRPDQEHIIGTYQNVDATNWQIVRPLVNADMLAKATDVSYTYKTVGGIDYGVTLVPLMDFKGKRIGAIIAVRNFEDYQGPVQAALVNAVAFALLQAVLLIGAVLVVFNGMLMRPVARLGRALSQLADGDSKIDLLDLPKRKDEVGVIARSLESLAKRGNS